MPIQPRSIIENVDWDLYQNSVLLVIKEAVRRYSDLNALGKEEPVVQHLLFEDEKSKTSVPMSEPAFERQPNINNDIYQISIWTYNQSAYTGVSFETKAHAQQFNFDREIRLRRSGLEEMAQKTAQLEYNSSISDFLYSNFYLYEHPELFALTHTNRFDNAQNYEAQRKIEEVLLKVIQEAIAAKLFDALPREDQIWIGISSTRDPYDHITLYQ